MKIAAEITARKSTSLNQRGMTLVEILIVLTIVAAMAAYLVPKLFGKDQQAKQKESQIRMANLGSALLAYNMDCGHFPTSLDALVTKDDCASWNPAGYAKKGDLKDGWGHEFVYDSKGASYNLLSLGRDGQEGGDGYDADIPSEKE